MLMALLAALGTPSLGVSAGRVEITPPEPLPLGGYTERADRLADPGGETLYARTVVFEVEGQRIAVVAVDLLTTPESLAAAVAERLPADVRLFLAATHTHSAPDSQMLNARLTFKVPGIASFKRRWLDWYAERIAQGVRGALDSPRRTVAAVAVAERHVPANRSRRGARSWPPTDTMFTAIGQPAGAPWMLHYAAHATVFGPERNQTSGDWVSRILERYDASLLLQGAIGDVSPVADDPTGQDPAVKMRNFLAFFDQVPLDRRRPVWTTGDPVRWVERAVDLGPATPHPEFAKAYGVPEALAQIVVKQFASPTATVRAFRLGKLAVVGVPAEPTAALGTRIRDAGRRLGFDPVLVVSHTNGWIGYVLEPWDYDRGGYEATLSFHGRETGERLVEAGVEALRALAGGASSR